MTPTWAQGEPIAPARAHALRLASARPIDPEAPTPEKLGKSHGAAAAAHALDSSHPQHHYQALLNGLDCGDPKILDSLPQADLSGQWADELNSTQLEQMFPNHPDPCSEYEEAFNQAVHDEIGRICLYHTT